jgi:hypothetical protein
MLSVFLGQFFRICAHPRWLFWLLPWFMVLLIGGTIAQRYIGLVEAQHLFFSSWILWLGFIPLLGGMGTLACITFNLLCKLLIDSVWQPHKAGIILSHLGVLMLLLGGAVHWLTSSEGYVTLLEGESTATMQDYYARELLLQRDGKPLTLWQETELHKGKILTAANLPFQIHLDDFCNNCGTFVQENPAGKHGIAQKILLQAIPDAKEKESNKAGLSFTLSGAGKEQDGSYIVLELLPSQAPQITVGQNVYRLELRRKTLRLPFTIKLLNFEKIRYPGSDQAQEYRSVVEIKDGKKQWQETIAMNEPLRYRGYALYQSSFLQTGDAAQASVLAVVKNDSWLAPYLATFVLAVGLLWHLRLRNTQRRKESHAISPAC